METGAGGACVAMSLTWMTQVMPPPPSSLVHLSTRNLCSGASSASRALHSSACSVVVKIDQEMMTGYQEIREDEMSTGDEDRRRGHETRTGEEDRR